MSAAPHVNGAAPRRRAPAPEPPKVPSTLAAISVTGYAASRAVLESASAVPWVWSGIIASGHAVEVCGPSASGKSTFTTLLAVATANPGEPVQLLGREVTPIAPGKAVLLVNEENGRASAVRQIDRAIEVLGLPPEQTWERVMLVSRAGVRARPLTGTRCRPRRGRQGRRRPRGARRGLRSRRLDTRAKIFVGLGASRDEEAGADASAMVTRLAEVAGCPVIVVSHTRKGGGEDLDDVSGSVQRAAGADVVLIVRAKKSRGGGVESSRIAVAKLRDDDGGEWPEPMAFTLAREDEHWTLSSAAEDDDGDEDGDGAAHERVHALLTRRGEMTGRQIRDELRMSNKALTEALRVLGAERRLTSSTRSVGGRPRQMYAATEELAAMAERMDRERRARRPST